MKLEFANTDKKINSTAIVSSYPLSLTGAKFKEECNLTFPVFMIGTNSISYTSYNYVKVTFDNNQIKYYFINSFELGTNNCWYINCTMDVLATFKSSILAKSLYVLRSASDYDSDVVDTLYPTTAKFTHVSSGSDAVGPVYITDRRSQQTETVSVSTYFNKDFIGGYFYLKILQGGASGVAGTTLYVMDYYGFTAFMSNIFQIDYSGDFEDIAQGVARSVANVLQYITECFWLPVINPRLNLSSRTIKLGTYSVTCPSCAIHEYPDGIEVEFNMATPSDHPQISRGKFLNTSPYSTRILKFYPFGVYDLSIPAYAINDDYINIKLEIDEYTGETLITISNHSAYATNRSIFVTDSKDYKVSIPLAESSLTLIGALGATLNANRTISSSNLGYNSKGEKFVRVENGRKFTASEVPEALQNPISTIGDLLQGAGTETHSNGTFGAILPYMIKPTIECEYCYITEEDLDHNGRPLCKTKQLSTLSGYCLCRDDDIGITGASQDQLDMIKSFLTGGFFIE